MGNLNCDCRVVGQVETNCYLVSDKKTGECVIIDPGDEYSRLVSRLRGKNLTPKAILLTHGHFDHILAVRDLREEFGLTLYAARAEQEVLADTQINLSCELPSPISLAADVWLSDQQEIDIIGHKVRCLLTPGHTCGSMCYFFSQDLVLFSGDTLFCGSVGRTDFPTGSMRTLVNSVREKLFVLPEQTKVYPGHGAATTIENEKMCNPFVGE